MAEPMLLGSPSSPSPGSSPSNPGAVNQAGNANQSFVPTTLPPFLLGEYSVVSPQNAGRRSAGAGNSPGRGNRSIFSPLSPGSISPIGSPPKNRYKDKLGGPPPTQGLMESFVNGTPDRSQRWPEVESKWNQSLSYNTADASVFGTNHNASTYDPNLTALSKKLSDSYQTPAEKDRPAYIQGETIKNEEEQYDCWVTVFGFLPPAASFVLQQFSQYGHILHYHVPSSGNWMHLHYKSKMQAKKALSKNGKIYNTNMMIGVSYCTDKEIISQLLGNSADMYSSSYLHPPGPPTNNSMLDTSNLKTSGLRPLTAVYNSIPKARHQVNTLTEDDPPRKQSGIVSKAMEYVFGW